MPVGSTSNAGKTGRGPIIEVKNLRKEYPVLDETVVALERVNLAIPQGQICCIYGESGSGKSTLLRCATMLETMDSGEVVYLGKKAAFTGPDGKAVYAPKKELKEIQGQYGLVFQNFNLFPHYSVLKNIIDAPIHVQKREKDQVIREARELLKKMGL